ncbi:hypothetical protein [Paracoccus aminophilus]|nr:hypothetical protein [Paracoccus aminophilus]
MISFFVVSIYLQFWQFAGSDMRAVHQGKNDLLAMALDRAFALNEAPEASRPMGIIDALTAPRPAKKPARKDSVVNALTEALVPRPSNPVALSSAPGDLARTNAPPSKLDAFRLSYPQYAQIPDDQLADALYGKFYGNMPRDQFNQAIGAPAGQAAQQPSADRPQTFEIQGPDGQTYEVQAPNQQAALDGFHRLTGGNAQTSGPWVDFASAPQGSGPWEQYQTGGQGGQPSTYDEIMAKARELQAAGRVEDAQRLTRIAEERRAAAQPQPAQASYADIMKALRNADAAGDTAAATRLAQMAKEAQAREQQAPATGGSWRDAPVVSGSSWQDAPIVELDGPDGTDDQTMSAAMQKVYGAPTQPAQAAPLDNSLEGRKARWAALKDGSLQPSPESLGRHAAANAIGEVQQQSREAPRWGLLDYLTGGRGGATMDAVGAGAAGASRGITGILDVPGAALNAGSRVGAWAAEKTGLATPEEASAASGVVNELAKTTRLGSGNSYRAAAAEATGGASEFRGDSRFAKYAGTVGEFLPSALLSPGNALRNALTYGVAPGLASEAAGQATEGTKLEPWARPIAAITASGLAGLAEKGVRALVSPHGGADAARLDLARVLDEAGVPVSAGQRTGHEGLMRKEGLTRAGQELNQTQREALTKAALKTAGTDATRATPEVLASTAQRIGAEFDDIARGVAVAPTPSTAQALAEANHAYQQLAPKASQAPLLKEIGRRVSEAAQTGSSIPANVVNSWRSNLSKLTTSADGATRSAAIEAMGALDDAMTATLQGLGRAKDVQRLAVAREQWRNFLAIQKAATGAGEEAAVGIISPSALRNAVVQQGRSSYAQGGRGELGELARAAEGVIKPLGSSGTAENLRAMGLPSVGWTSLGAGAGAYFGGGPAGALVGSMVGAAAPAMVGAARMSGPGQAWLANQLVGKGVPAFSTNLLGPLSPATLDMPSRGLLSYMSDPENDPNAPKGNGILSRVVRESRKK